MPDAAAHAARFDLWAGGETLEAGPTACSMRWRPRAPEPLVIPEVTVGTSVVIDETHYLTLADMEAASAAVRALHAPPVDAGSEPQTYATGGLVSSGTLAIVGEDGGCTMPLPWWRRMLGGNS